MPTRDGVLVIRHENELSTTTDVAERPEFAHLCTTKVLGDVPLTGWFTEDFTWDELSILRCRERIPAIRPANTRFDGTEPIPRLADLFDVLRTHDDMVGTQTTLVAEVKSPTYFAHQGIDMASLLATETDDARARGWTGPLVIESFEATVLDALRDRARDASLVYLIEHRGSPGDLVARYGAQSPTYADETTPAALDRLVGRVDGVSLSKKLVLAPDAHGRATGPAPVVAEAKDRGLRVYAWTARPENAFLEPEFRIGAEDADHGDWAAEWAILRGAGLDGVFVDHPDLGVAFFHEGER